MQAQRKIRRVGWMVASPMAGALPAVGICVAHTPSSASVRAWEDSARTWRTTALRVVYYREYGAPSVLVADHRPVLPREVPARAQAAQCVVRVVVVMPVLVAVVPAPALEPYAKRER